MRTSLFGSVLLAAACAGTTTGPTEERPTPTPAEPSPGAATPGASAKEPRHPKISLSAWTDAPVRMHRVGATWLGSAGEDLAIVRNGRVEQDPLLTRVPNCGEAPDYVAGQIVDIAGDWPATVFMTRRSVDPDRKGLWVYRWSGTAWTVVKHVNDERARLVGTNETVVLATQDRSKRSYAVDVVAGKSVRPTPSTDPKCGTRLAELTSIVPGAEGELLAWGGGCDGVETLERLRPDSPASISTWDHGKIEAVGVSADGETVVALASGQGGASEVVVDRDGVWETTGKIAGRVQALASAEGSTWALSEESSGTTLWTLDPQWTQVVVPEGAAAMIGLHGSGQQLWVTSNQTLLSTVAPPAGPWEWFRRGCGVGTFGHAKPYRNDPRRRTQTCGNAFALVAESTEDTPPPGWVAIYQALGPWIENGWLQRQGERIHANTDKFGVSGPETKPGHRITPVVAREMDRRYFGFRVVGGRDLVYEGMQLIEEARAQGPQGSKPRWLCIDPLGYPEAQIRAMAGAQK